MDFTLLVLSHFLAFACVLPHTCVPDCLHTAGMLLAAHTVRDA